MHGPRRWCRFKKVECEGPEPVHGTVCSNSEPREPMSERNSQRPSLLTSGRSLATHNSNSCEMFPAVPPPCASHRKAHGQLMHTPRTLAKFDNLSRPLDGERVGGSSLYDVDVGDRPWPGRILISRNSSPKLGVQDPSWDDVAVLRRGLSPRNWSWTMPDKFASGAKIPNVLGGGHLGFCPPALSLCVRMGLWASPSTRQFPFYNFLLLCAPGYVCVLQWGGHKPRRAGRQERSS